jgi:putative hydroxymethylpyrimidine transport system ATP-binding protein
MPNSVVPTSPSIYLNHVTVTFEHHLVFNDFSLTIPSGQWTCLLGSSGVGKSTLLRLVAGLTHPITPGEQCSHQITTSDSQPLHHKIAYMAQQDLLMPWLTVLDNVLVGYQLRHTPISTELRAQAEELLTTVGLQDAMHLTPAKLSGGMRQRVALVRTLLENRPVVLMDEPFSALDTTTRLKLHDVAVQLLKNKTVLFITHDPLEALRLGDTIYLLAGTPAQVVMQLSPQGLKPRALSDAALLQAHATLLNTLIGTTSWQE